MFIYLKQKNSEKNKKLIGFVKYLFISFFILLFFSSSIVYATEITPNKLIELVNYERRINGLEELHTNQLLQNAATSKANHMIENDYFDHYSPSGTSPWFFIKKSGYIYSMAGENLAMDFRTSEGVHNAWMASPSHKANIINPNYEDIGIAVIFGSLNNHQTSLVVEMFGKKSSNAIEKVNTLALKITQFILGHSFNGI